MSELDLLVAEARNHRTVVLTASERDGSIETREIEPYSIRRIKGRDRLFYYCLKKAGLRNAPVDRIITVERTGQKFVPRWPVEL